MVAIHRRVAKDECFVVLRGKVRVTTHDDDGAVIGDVVLSWVSGCYVIIANMREHDFFEPTWEQ